MWGGGVDVRGVRGALCDWDLSLYVLLADLRLGWCGGTWRLTLVLVNFKFLLFEAGDEDEDAGWVL